MLTLELALHWDLLLKLLLLVLLSPLLLPPHGPSHPVANSPMVVLPTLVDQDIDKVVPRTILVPFMVTTITPTYVLVSKNP